MHFLYLALAIVAEVIGTTALKAADGFTNLWPSVLVVLGYGAAIFLLSLVLQRIPVGIAYAVWAGLGIVLVAVAGALVYRQVPDVPALVGIALIVAGVVIMQLYSKTLVH